MNEIGCLSYDDPELKHALGAVFCARHILIVTKNDAMHGEWFVVHPNGRIGRFCKKLLKQHGTSC